MKIKYGKNIDIDSVELISNKKNEKTLLLKRGLVKTYLHRKHRPVEEARRQIDVLDNMNEANTLIIWGIGLGYIIEEYLKEDKPMRVIIFEPSKDIFELAVKENSKLKELIESNEIDVYIGDIRDKRIELTMMLLGGYTGLKYILNPRYIDAFKIEYQEFVDFFGELIKSVSTLKNTVIEASLKGQINLLRNMKHIFESYPISIFDNKFEGFTGILVAAGPSLDESIEFLKEAEGKSIIIAVDTALQVLLKRGIKPDFVIAIESSDANFEHFRNIEYDEIPMIYDIGSNFKVPEKHRGKKILISSDGSYIDRLYSSKNIKIGSLDSFFSVSVPAFEFLINLGCSTIIMTGLDLSYKDVKKSHVSGSAFSAKPTLIEEISLKNVHGQSVYTVVTYYETLKLIESKIKKNNTIKYINTSDQGVMIEGSELLSMRDAIELYCHTNRPLEFEKIFNENKNLKLDKLNILSIVNELKNIYENINKTILKFEQCGITKRGESLQLFKNMNQIDELVNSIFNEFEILNLIRLKIEFRYEELLNSLSKEKNAENIRKKTMELYREIYFICIELNPIVKELYIYFEKNI